MLQKIIFSIITITLFVSGLGFEHVTEFYLDMPSLYIVLFLTLSVSLIVFPINHIWYTVLHLFGKKDSIPPETIITHREFYLFSSNTALATGVIGQIISMIAMLYNMADPSSIGPTLALAMITLLYGVVLSQIILRPLAKNLELSEGLPAKNQSNITGLLIAILCPFVSVINYFIPLLAMSHIHG